MIDASLEKSAIAGDAAAQFLLGCRYAEGDGVAKDILEAVKWYRKSAEQGHANAQYFLGRYYQNYRGSPGYSVGNGDTAEDYAEAAKWYRKAADQGNADAQRSLGVYYAEGHGVAQDNIESIKWNRKAAEQERIQLQENLEKLRAEKKYKEAQKKVDSKPVLQPQPPVQKQTKSFFNELEKNILEKMWSVVVFLFCAFLVYGFILWIAHQFTPPAPDDIDSDPLQGTGR